MGTMASIIIGQIYGAILDKKELLPGKICPIKGNRSHIINGAPQHNNIIKKCDI